MAIDLEQQLPRDGVDLRDILQLLWAGKWLILACVILFAAIGVGVALYLPDQYRSEAVYKPAGSEELLPDGGLLAQVGALAGVNLGIGSSATADLSVEILRSRPFLVGFAQRHGVVVELMAGEGWDRDRGVLLIDTSLYDPGAKRWLRKVAAPLTPEPNGDEIYERMKEILTVERDTQTGFVKVAITFLSPVLAHEWLQAMVHDLNEQLRQRDIVTRERSIAYLTKKLEENTIRGLDTDLSDLLKTEIREHMLAKVRQEYALETVAAPYRPVLKSGPNRLLLVVVAAMLGVLAGSVAVLVLRTVIGRR